MKNSIKKITIGILVILSIGLISFVLWGSFPMKAELSAFERISNDTRLTIVDEKKFVKIQQKDSISTTGIIYYPGARVEANAYVSKLGHIVIENDIKVFITKPIINFAIFGINDALPIIRNNPEVKSWFIAGHSLGGAMACEFANKNRTSVEGLILFGSYCASDISNSSLKVLSISGSRDGLSTTEKVNASKKMLPTTATVLIIEGSNHAQMGNYGTQKGDLEPQKADEATQIEMTNAIKFFFSN